MHKKEIDDIYDDMSIVGCNKVADENRWKQKAIVRKFERKAYIFFFIVMFITSVVFICRLCIFDINCVVGESMEPTLQDGDVLLVEKYDTTSISRYDIVTIKVNDENSNKDVRIIKRVYGLPGETIAIHMDGSVYINHHRLDDKYQILSTITDSNGNDVSNVVFDDIAYEVTLGAGEYYVLGDNRDVSKDSRFYGPILRENIQGVVMTRLKPFQSIYDTEIVDTK